MLRQHSRGLRESGNSSPGSLLVGVRGGQRCAGGDRRGCLLGNGPELGWDLSDLGSLPSSATSSSCSLGHISSGCFGRNHRPPSGVPMHQELPQEIQFAPKPFPCVASGK